MAIPAAKLAASAVAMNASTGAAKPRTSRSTCNSIRLPSNERIRSDFLHKLGIETTTNEISQQPKRATRSVLGNVPVYQEPLKYEDQMPSEEPEGLTRSNGSWHSFFQIKQSTSPTTVVSEPQKPRRRKLSFDDHVKVVPIPMRDDYSDRVKDRLWMNADEIEMSAYRNAVEFTAEGWDWRTVTEDDGMYTCTETGEKIHPVHMEPEEYME